MKLTLNAATLVLFVIIQMTACRKKDVPAPPEPEECRITGMTYSGGILKNMIATANYTYNNAGNPLSVLVSSSGTGNPHSLFFYDQYNRLTDYISTYKEFTDPANMPASFAFEVWIRYVYADLNPSSMPVRDTVRIFGIYTNGKYDFINSMRVETLTYDSEGRIVRPEGYDANGNLNIRGVTYDNKINYRRTNKVWMLVDKNFSVNNPLTATAYNSAGYPLTFPDPPPPNFNTDFFLLREVGIRTISYSCSTVKGGSKK